MRLLKAQNTNLRNIYGKGVKYDVDDQVIVDSTNVMLVPKGTGDVFYAPGTSGNQRPVSPTNGHIRYNTDTNEFEGYQNGAWRKFRFKEPNQNPGITVQTLGYGDAVEVFFGPLNSGDTDYPVPVDEQNILVFVENVYQLPTTNYSLFQNPALTNTIASIVSTGATTVIQTATNHGYSADDLVYIEDVDSGGDNCENLNTPGASPTSFNIASIPAANQIEVEVDTTGGGVGNYVAGSGTVKRASSIDGQFYPDGWYLQFTSAVDLSKPVTVLHNFDK